ncbi:MAG TPA: PAAR domain-containing protein [Polyangia bacterium]|nr:PAAR domain-containing protein [Polyangia bacterium]
MSRGGRPAAHVGSKTNHGITSADKQTVHVGGRPVSYVNAPHSCKMHKGKGRKVASGAPTVLVYGVPVTRVDEKMTCSCKVVDGVQNVLVGDAKPELGPLEPVDLWIRLDLDPQAASVCSDRYILTASDGSYRRQKIVLSNHIPNQETVDLHYLGLHRSKSYSLEVIEEGGASTFVFQNVPYPQLAGLKGPARTPPPAGGGSCSCHS